MAGGHVWWGACMAGGMHARGCVWQGGVCGGEVQHGRGHAWQGCVHGREGGMHAGEMATAASGMHPTGIHSCLAAKFSLVGSPTGN